MIIMTKSTGRTCKVMPVKEKTMSRMTENIHFKDIFNHKQKRIYRELCPDLLNCCQITHGAECTGAFHSIAVDVLENYLLCSHMNSFRHLINDMEVVCYFAPQCLTITEYYSQGVISPSPSGVGVVFSQPFWKMP